MLEPAQCCSSIHEMKSIIVFTITLFVAHSTAESACPTFAPFYRYFRGDGTDHFYTTNILEIRTAVPGQTGDHGYTSEGIACILRTTPTSKIHAVSISV